MKKILLTTVILAGVFAANINNAVFASPVAFMATDTLIKVEDLPEAVKQTIAQKFEGWTAITAFWVSGENEHYKIELNKGDEKKAVKINKDGSLADKSTEFNDFQNETPVKVEDLPTAVKETIATKYEGWTATAASLVSGENEFYKVELTKEEAKQIIKITKDGKIIE